MSMFKKEIIWREILYQALEKDKYDFEQKKLAEEFDFSLSTVFNALKTPEEIKAIEKWGRGFKLTNPEKLLYLWATERKLDKSIIYSTFVPENPARIESLVPDQSIWALYSAYKYKFQDTPSDYARVYIYAPEKDLPLIKERFPEKKGPKNFFLLQADEYLKKYGTTPPLAQIFVDIWNTNDWYANEFLNRLKLKMDL